MGDEYLDTFLETKSDEFIKSSVENLVPSPSESEDKRECDVPACDDFTTFSNLLFDTDDDFSSGDDKSFSDEDIPKEIYSNPLFNKEIISIKIDPHHFNAESDIIESLLNQDSLIISSSKIDSLLDEFAGELILLKSTPPGIDKADCDPEEEIRLIEKLLYDNSSPRPSEEFISEYSNAAIESFLPLLSLLRIVALLWLDDDLWREHSYLGCSISPFLSSLTSLIKGIEILSLLIALREDNNSLVLRESGNGYQRNGQNPSKTEQNRARNEKRAKVNQVNKKSTPTKSRPPSHQEKEIQLQGLKVPKLQTYNTRTEVAITMNKIAGSFLPNLQTSTPQGLPVQYTYKTPGIISAIS
nr:hypothetical protein [Tanacetum cinerariifolium]